VEPGHPELSIRQQLDLLQLSPSSYYYQPEPPDPCDDQLMRLIDLEHTERPFYGVERITWALRQMGHSVNPKRVRCLMRTMAIEAIYPKPRTSQAGHPSRKFPYLLGGLDINRPDMAWATDITYIPLRRGFCYLCVMMDWATRYVLSWELSNTLDSIFCLDTLEQAFAGGTQAGNCQQRPRLPVHLRRLREQDTSAWSQGVMGRQRPLA
jgi:putative transposase